MKKLRVAETRSCHLRPYRMGTAYVPERLIADEATPQTRGRKESPDALIMSPMDPSDPLRPARGTKISQDIERQERASGDTRPKPRAGSEMRP